MGYWDFWGRLLVRVCFAALLTAQAVTATAADLTREISFNIPRQPLAQALAEFSRQSDVIIVAASELTDGKVCNPVSTTTTAAKALAQLLDGTKLTYMQDKD